MSQDPYLCANPLEVSSCLNLATGQSITLFAISFVQAALTLVVLPGVYASKRKPTAGLFIITSAGLVYSVAAIAGLLAATSSFESATIQALDRASSVFSIFYFIAYCAYVIICLSVYHADIWRTLVIAALCMFSVASAGLQFGAATLTVDQPYTPIQSYYNLDLFQSISNAGVALALAFQLVVAFIFLQTATNTGARSHLFVFGAASASAIQCLLTFISPTFALLIARKSLALIAFVCLVLHCLYTIRHPLPRTRSSTTAPLKHADSLEKHSTTSSSVRFFLRKFVVKKPSTSSEPSLHISLPRAKGASHRKHVTYTYGDFYSVSPISAYNRQGPRVAVLKSNHKAPQLAFRSTSPIIWAPLSADNQSGQSSQRMPSPLPQKPSPRSMPSPLNPPQHLAPYLNPRYQYSGRTHTPESAIQEGRLLQHAFQSSAETSEDTVQSINEAQRNREIEALEAIRQRLLQFDRQNGGHAVQHMASLPAINANRQASYRQSQYAELGLIRTRSRSMQTPDSDRWL